EREEPEGRHPGVGRQGGPEPAEVLGYWPRAAGYGAGRRELPGLFFFELRPRRSNRSDLSYLTSIGGPSLRRAERHHRCDGHFHRLAVLHMGRVFPLAHGFDCRVVEPRDIDMTDARLQPYRGARPPCRIDVRRALL